ncbi:cell division protein FtsZ, partial [Xanthomarina gelatinilytica]
MSSNKEFESNISFDLPKNQSNVIKVIGVGGGGSNAINHMFQQGIKGVDFVICNTDAQALQNSGVPNKIQLGVNLTEGLGAGANPDVGEKSAIESFEDIQRMLDTNTKMVFITAGMGGGTGTGAAPIIAKMAKDLDILTVGIVTMPFQFEGKMRNEQAQIGIENLRSVVDSLVVINNNKLREVYGNLGFKAGFSKADEVLSTAARGIAEVITHHYTQNIDLRDAKTVLSNSGTAIMGSATSSGQNRAHDAISKALDSPLLNDNKITGAKNVLLLIVSGSQEITIDEIGEINDHIQNEAGHGANIIMGVGEDESLEESIAVTIIATGFNIDQQDEISNTEAKKVIHALEEDKPFEQDLTKKEQAPPIITPNIELEEKKEPPVVKHTLDLDELEELDGPNHILSENELVPTTEAIKNMDVVYDEVLVNAEEEDFVIT